MPKITQKAYVANIQQQLIEAAGNCSVFKRDHLSNYHATVTGSDSFDKVKEYCSTHLKFIAGYPEDCYRYIIDETNVVSLVRYEDRTVVLVQYNTASFWTKN